MTPALASYIATRDRKVGTSWDATPLAKTFAELQAKGITRMGGRTSCGGAVDPTWKQFTARNEVVRKAQSLGYEIEVTPIKHGNGWATKARGFWDENDYVLTATVKESLSVASQLLTAA